MDLKEALYNIILSNLSNSHIRGVYDKAVSISAPIKTEPMVAYIKVYSYSTFTRFIHTKLTKAQFEAITDNKSFLIPVPAFGNKYSIGYEVLNTSGNISYDEDVSTIKGDLSIFEKLRSYEFKMLDGHTSREDNEGPIS